LVIIYDSSKSNFDCLRLLRDTRRAFKHPGFAIDVIGQLDTQKLHR
jgi:hypothetical protein